MRALYMRKKPTPAESRLWQQLRGKRILGYRFRRQHPVDQFIVDFYCRDARLVIEVDGPIHGSPQAQEYDEARQKCLEERGLSLLRFTNDQVLYAIDAVLEEIAAYLNHHAHYRG